VRINNEEGARAYSQLYGVVRMIDIMLNRKQLNCALRVGRGRVYQVGPEGQREHGDLAAVRRDTPCEAAGGVEGA